jgi:hypothetical protein
MTREWMPQAMDQMDYCCNDAFRGERYSVSDGREASEPDLPWRRDIQERDESSNDLLSLMNGDLLQPLMHDRRHLRPEK